MRKGEKSIRIAPMTVRRRGAHGTTKDDDKRTVFRAVPVFDVGQADPLLGREPVAVESSRHQPEPGRSIARRSAASTPGASLLLMMRMKAAQSGAFPHDSALPASHVIGGLDLGPPSPSLDAALTEYG